MLSEYSTYEKIYEEFWKEIIEDENGNLNKDQIMRELADYNFILQQVPKVYIEIANLSKPLYKADVIIDKLHERFIRKEFALDDLLEILKDYPEIHEILTDYFK